MRGKYRLRTWLRGRLPWFLSERTTKGARDCGAHEWHRVDDSTWRCYHCVVGVTHESPWTPEEQLQHSLAGTNAILRSLVDREPTDYEVAIIHRLVAEAREVLPVEDERLIMLQEASPPELGRFAEELAAH